jgi:transposase-like protein
VAETPSHADGICDIIEVGRRRDGGTRYWCLLHKADATAKYGKPAKECRYARVAPLAPGDTYTLDLDKYPGGVALWGAVPPVYDTLSQVPDRGVHLHAHRSASDDKEIDHTYRAVRITGGPLAKNDFVVSELDAIYYMVSSVFGYEMRHLTCLYCGEPHLDRDWFSLHPHRRHLCAGCGRNFRDSQTSIGNPIAGIRDTCAVRATKAKRSRKRFIRPQEQFPGGIQIWGSNPAFLWTGNRSEEEGIHVHAFTADETKPEIDDTFGTVIIDDIELDATMIRTFMAQSALPHIAGRVASINCPFCKRSQFSTGDEAFTPIVERRCEYCDRRFAARGRLRKTIANPLPAILERLGRAAPRPPRKHRMDLIPETL